MHFFIQTYNRLWHRTPPWLQGFLFTFFIPHGVLSCYLLPKTANIVLGQVSPEKGTKRCGIPRSTVSAAGSRDVLVERPIRDVISTAGPVPAFPGWHLHHSASQRRVFATLWAPRNFFFLKPVASPPC